MKQFLNTIKNCMRLRTFSFFNVLYNEVDVEVDRIGYTELCIFTYDSEFDIPLRISIGKNMSKRTMITGLLHEVGHMKDFEKMKTTKKYLSRPTEVREKIAWKNCIRLADKYNIKLDLKSAQKWLGSYNTNYKVLDNRIERLG